MPMQIILTVRETNFLTKFIDASLQFPVTLEEKEKEQLLKIYWKFINSKRSDRNPA